VGVRCRRRRAGGQPKEERPRTGEYGDTFKAGIIDPAKRMPPDGGHGKAEPGLQGVEGKTNAQLLALL
jgi:hypothetical protein